MKENYDIINFTQWNNIREFKVPNVKLDEFLYNIKVAGPKYKKIVAQYFKSYEDYVDLIDKKKHLCNVNDLTGDILGNERVKIKCIIFDKDDIENIQENFVTYALSEFYSEIPDMLDIFGISLKPLSYIKKDDVKFTFKQTITFDTVINIIGELSGMNYEGETQEYHIWSDKAKQQQPQIQPVQPV